MGGRGKKLQDTLEKCHHRANSRGSIGRAAALEEGAVRKSGGDLCTEALNIRSLRPSKEKGGRSETRLLARTKQHQGTKVGQRKRTELGSS